MNSSATYDAPSATVEQSILSINEKNPEVEGNKNNHAAERFTNNAEVTRKPGLENMILRINMVA
jgi:phosphoenolpyruvate carboxylase